MFTSQTDVDADIIQSTLETASLLFDRIRFLEVGTLNGDTSREIKAWCDQNKVPLDFWGIDAGWHPDFKGTIKPPVPFEGAHLIIGDSAEVFHLVPDTFNVVLLDGCHCINHVILDTVHYGNKVVYDGFLMFHDTSPEIQHTMKDPHGPDIPEFRNSVLAAHKLMGFPTSEWSFKHSDFKRGAPWGGIQVYQKKA